MSGDPGDLANMADLTLPAVVSFWPPAAAVWIIGGTVAAAAAVAAGRAVRRYRADAYLRQAMTEIDGQMPIGRLSAVLKRVAIVAYGRERVASLTGPEWAVFLAQSRREGRVDVLVAELQTAMSTSASTQPAAVAQARDWLAAQRGRVSRER